MSVEEHIELMRKVIGGTGEQPEVVKAIKGFEKIIEFTMKDIGAKWYFDTTGGKVTFHEGEAESPFLRVETDTETWTKILSGKMNAMAAMLRRKMKTKGPLSAAMKIGPIMDVWIQAYKEI